MDTVIKDAVWFYSLKNLSRIISRVYFLQSLILFIKLWKITGDFVKVFQSSCFMEYPTELVAEIPECIYTSYDIARKVRNYFNL